MLRANRKSRWRTTASVGDERLSVREKRVDIPIVDNKEFRKKLIARIEAVTLEIIKQISTERSPSISYSNGQNIATESQSSQSSTDSPYSGTSLGDFTVDSLREQDRNARVIARRNSKTTVNFGTRRSRDKFILMIVIMAEAHSLLLANMSKTRRSFYYDLKKESTKYLVSDQRYIDRALNDVASLLECSPWELKLLATAKGLVAGNMTITLADNQVIDCAVPGGALIPQITSDVISIRARANFVLVVEKDAAFQKLLKENCPRLLNCILVTGKGYPDVATRMLVKMLSEKMDLPVYIVVDADPFGVDIMLIYRYGSTIRRKENDNLVCPDARWLGIFPSELVSLGAKTIPLTKADLAKLRSIEIRTYVNKAISKELSVLRKGKAEIEAVSSFSKNFLTATYLRCKIDGHDYI